MKLHTRWTGSNEKKTNELRLKKTYVSTKEARTLMVLEGIRK